MKKTLLKNGLVIDLNSNVPLKKNILIDTEGNIEKITEELIACDSSINIVDCEGKYVLPGLINAHAHLFSTGKPFNSPGYDSSKTILYKILGTSLGRLLLRIRMHKHAYTQLQSGITTIRTLGEFFYQDVKLSNRYKKDKLGPDIFTAGYFLTITGGHGAPYLALEGDSPWEHRKNVRKNLHNGVDWIKICVTGGVTDAEKVGEAGELQLTLEEISAICEEAHRVGRLVAAHAESTEGVRLALMGGVDSVEHGAPMDEHIISLYKNNPNSYRGYTVLVPTFQAVAPIALLNIEKTSVSDVVYSNGKTIYEDMVQSFLQAIENNIQLAIGNDSSMSYVTHYDFWRELDYFVSYGKMNPIEVLKIATQNNAKLLGIETKCGCIKEGFTADIIILSENPLENIRNLENIDMVFKRGRLVKKKKVKKFHEIDSLLCEILPR